MAEALESGQGVGASQPASSSGPQGRWKDGLFDCCEQCAPTCKSPPCAPGCFADPTLLTPLSYERATPGCAAYFCQPCLTARFYDQVSAQANHHPAKTRRSESCSCHRSIAN